MFKTLGIVIILGSFTAFGYLEKLKLSKRTKSLEQIILSLEIMQRELNFNNIHLKPLILILSKQTSHPVNKIFKQMHKSILIDDDLSIEYKWGKAFKDYGEFASFLQEDIDKIISISSVLGKYDVLEQVKSLEYHKSSLIGNLTQAQRKFSSEGNIIKTIAISVGMIIVIILI